MAPGITGGLTVAPDGGAADLGMSPLEFFAGEAENEEDEHRRLNAYRRIR